MPKNTESKTKIKLKHINKEYSSRKQAEWMIKDLKVHKTSVETNIIEAQRKEELLLWAKQYKLELMAKAVKSSES